MLILFSGIANAQSGNYLFAYFTNNGEDGLHLAYSHDGLKWQALNDGKSYLTPKVGSQKLMRDPCILQGPDGQFHMVWTTGWEGRDIGIAHSKDLIHWSEQKAIPVMAAEPTAMNCWAPEIVYDQKSKQYLIFWSTTIPGKFPETLGSAGKDRNHRIYYVTTKDFSSYSPARLFYDGGFNVIDATIIQDARRFVMIVKDETEFPSAKKDLRLAFSNNIAGPYSTASAPFTTSWVEGPTTLKVNGEWLVYYDKYREKKYGASKTRDFKSWEDISEQLVVPQGIRHGTTFQVSEAVLSRLQTTWRNAQQQKAEWFSSPDALRVADNLLLWQRASGGWPKNTDMAIVLSEQQRAVLLQEQAKQDSTIDNGSTYTQLDFLARVYRATKQARFKDSFIKGLDYLFQAQYENGGWPQFYPLASGYYSHITYNDDAMIGVLKLLREIQRGNSLFEFVDAPRRLRAGRAVEKGIDVILKTQVVVNGRKTVWCAQHDEHTLAPAPARSYEKISLSGSESVGIVRFLMELDNPSPAVVDAIQSAIDWFERAKIKGIKVVNKPAAALPRGFDRIVVSDEKADPIWARFYDISTNRPIFCGRDGIIKSSLAEIEHERRTGYAWYSGAANQLLTRDYPAWQKKPGGKSNTASK